MKIIKLITVSALTSFTLGCATSLETQMANARSQGQTVTFAERPALYDSLGRRGKLSAEGVKSLQEEWQQANKQRQKLLASMTPAQRASYELQEQQIALQQQQIKMQEALQSQVAASAISSQQSSYNPSGGLVPVPQPQTQIVYPSTYQMPTVAPYTIAR